ncbi:MAG: hypothetical protein ABI370_03625 [Gammaproteobacteria bacterium]
MLKNVVVGFEELAATYDKCKMVIGANGVRGPVQEAFSADEKATVVTKNFVT